MFGYHPVSKAEQLKGHQKEKDKPKFKQQRPPNKPKAAPKKKTKRISKENRIPSMSMRKKFNQHVIDEAIQRFNGLCANCQVVKPFDPHHIRRRSDGGKGVITNCLPVCRPCHNEIERNVELRQYWKEWAKKEYGHDYWMDEWDKDKLKAEKIARQGNITDEYLKNSM